jgi:LPXTG-motif cell wall-anchored protein
MRTPTTRTHRAAATVAGAVAALLVGTAGAPAAFADAGGKSAGHAKSASQHQQKNKKTQTAEAAKSEKKKSTSPKPSSGGDNRASSNKEGQGHNDKWQAQSDPDGDENGGIDQPGGTGGYDPKGWDGNNGSGNDPDCEDDNRGKGVPGHCKARPAKPGKPAESPTKPQPSEQPTKPTTGEKPEGDRSTDETVAALPTPSGPVVTETVTEVLGLERFSSSTAGRVPTAAGTPAAAATAGTDAAPAATAAEVDNAGGVLPDTGADAAMLAMALSGLGAAGAGAVMVRRGRASQH